MTQVEDVPDETSVLQDLRAAHASLLADVQATGWTDDEVHAPIALPQWTRGHVLSHLARNADGMAGMLAGGLRGEPVPMYPSREARAADIEAGAGRPTVELIADLRESGERLDRVLGAVADGEDWTFDCGDGRVAGDLLLMRWCEIEIHRVDLGLGAPADWPPQFVGRILPVTADPPVLATHVDRPVRLVLTADGLDRDLDGTEWAAAPDGDDRAAVEVRGGDWAVLAWLTGRDAPVEVSQEIERSDWRLFGP